MELLKDPGKRSSTPGKGKSTDLQQLNSLISPLAKYENVDLPGYKQPEVYKEDVIVSVFSCDAILQFISHSNKEH